MYLIYLAVLSFVTAVHSQGYKDAVFVALSRSISISGWLINPVKFDHIGVDTNGSYNTSTGKVIFSQTGVYWAAVSHGISSGQDAVAAIMRNGSYFASSPRAGEGYLNGVDTLSRDIMMPVTRLQSVHVRGVQWTGFNYVMYSDKGLQTSLTLFRLTSLMRTPVMFSAVRETDTDGSVSEILHFPQVFVNEGNMFNTSTGMFTAPKDGLYFFSYSVGFSKVEHFFQGDAVLRHNHVFSLGTLERFSTISYWYDTLSRAGMYSLRKGDIVYITINKVSRVWSNRSYRPTSFSGFLYEPIHGKKVAWSVAKTSSWSSNTFLSPVPFDDVLVNEGGSWLTNRHVFICPTTGLYYITLTAGAQAHKPVHLSVIVDIQPKIVLNRASTKHDGVDMLSRSAILFLEAGSQVSLLAAANTALHSTRERQTSFTGFLLFPCDKPKK